MLYLPKCTALQKIVHLGKYSALGKDKFTASTDSKVPFTSVHHC